VFDYKTIVWNVVQGVSSSALNRLANFFDPFVPDRANQVVPFNYLSVYLDNGGEMFVTGNIPAFVLFDVMNSGPPPAVGEPVPDKLPVNVTDWDDRIFSHAAEESVGAASLLYRLGVEAVDVGSGERTTEPRKYRLDQGCTGFRRATPEGFERQGFRSSTVLGHTHICSLATADVERPPAAGVTYTTQVDPSGHTHQVTLSQAQLKLLARGDVFTVESTESPSPEPHAHEFLLRDQVGLWAAPARLLTDDAFWPSPFVSNPYRGRAGVEIYNMPVFCAQQSPP
jgi:hypothetical protein